MDYRQYIVRDPKICGGQPVMNGTRVPLKTVLASLADGDTVEELLENFPTLTLAHVRAAAAEKYKPARIRFLLVAEAPPRDPSRHFYLEHVRSGDSLFIQTMRTLYADCRTEEAIILRSRKRELLERFRKDGFYLVDACSGPIERGENKPARIRGELHCLIQVVHKLISERPAPGNVPVVLISKTVYQATFNGLTDEGFKVKNDRNDGWIPFPGSGHQPEFRKRLWDLLANNGWSPNGSRCS